ncbi:MAG: hypothetical protein SGPRY_004486, partial [Prymnesium sp.]
ELAAREQFGAMCAFCEAFELDLGHSTAPRSLSLTLHKLHMLSYLLTHQPGAARFLWKRLPADVKADGELSAIWQIGKHMWHKNPPGVQQATRGFGWAQPLIASLVEKLREDAVECSLKAIGGAYSSISLSVLAASLGVEQSTAQSLANAAGWTVNAESGLYTPSVPQQEKHRASGLDQLQTLTNYVAHVEYEVG